MEFNLKRNNNNNTPANTDTTLSNNHYDDVNSMLSELDNDEQANFDMEPPSYFNDNNQPPLDDNMTRSYTEPDETIGTEEENLVKYENSPSSTSNMSYEGEKITDLQGTGLNTSQLLTEEKKTETTTPFNSSQYNRALLDSLPLRSVLKAFGAEEIKSNLYRWNEYDISLKDNKWYNTHTDITRGHINALSLTKHLFSLQNKLSEKDDQKQLYYLAREFLVKLSQTNLEEDITPEVKAPETVYQDNQPVNNAVAQRSKEENNALFRELVEQLSNIDLEIVMEDIGANPNEDGHRGKWKVWSTGDNIQLTGQQWYSWKAQDGGIGALSLLQFHLATIHNLDLRIEEQRKEAWKMAFNELKSKFSESDLKDLVGSGGKLETKLNFHMPHQIPFKLNEVRHYLNIKRGLPLWIINKQIKAKSLFAGFPADWRENKNLKSPEKLANSDVWAVFLSAHETAAEMRAIERTDHTAKILAKGSAKELGGFLLKAEQSESEKTVSTLEASIDAMSYHAFYPGRIAMSCMGVNFKLAVKAAVDALDREYNFQFAFDNDQAGNEAALRFREELIIALGDEEYREHVQANRIHYFDLGIRCLEESIRTNKTFYLDVQDNHIGVDVVKLFQEQASRKIGKSNVLQAIHNGQLKYLNLSPNFEIIKDIQKEAKVIFDKLNSGKPYYLRIKQEDMDSDEMSSVQKEQLKEKMALFMDTFKNLAGDKFEQWEKEGLIIHSKIAIAKDWNEYFLYMKENNLEFKKSLVEQEKKYQHYSIKDEEEPTVKKKSKRM